MVCGWLLLDAVYIFGWLCFQLLNRPPLHTLGCIDRQANGEVLVDLSWTSSKTI